jgi:hypothetical protein
MIRNNDQLRNVAPSLASLALATLLACIAVVACTWFTSPVKADACGPSWSTVPSAKEVLIARAIEPIAPDDIWIVGGGGPSNEPYTTAAEHWDGTSWTAVSTPNVGTADNLLTSVSALDSDYAWAVGYSLSRKGASYATLVEHWDGNNWQVVPSPNVGTGANTLTGVQALTPNLAWAVGYYRESTSRKRTMIQRWDGTSWSIVRSPNPGTQSSVLLGVAAVAAADVWAVGWKSSGEGIKSLVLHYDGTSWKAVGMPKLGTGDNVLTSISAAGSDDIWASGYYVDGTQHKALTFHYDGTTWGHVPSPDEGDGVTALRDISTSSSTDAWAVGFEYRAELDEYVASSQHWDGSSWTTIPSAISEFSPRGSDMFAVGKASSTTRVWAAGQPANVETICPSESTTSAGTASGPGDSAVGPTESPYPASVSSPEAEAATENVGTATAPIEVTAVDKAAEAGISEKTTTFGAFVSDINNDGLEDIYISRHDLHGRLYRNDGNGHFTETNPESLGPSHNCAAADVNDDGLKDIYCTEGAGAGTHAKANMLYIQQPDHTFVDRADRYGVLDPFARGRFATFINANNDAQPDLFVGNSPDRGDGLPSFNRLFVGKGTTYRSAPRFGLEREVESQDGEKADLDKDGWQDLVVVGQDLRVYRNDQGNGFAEVTTSVGLGNLHPEDVALVDLNGDTWTDMIGVKYGKLSVFLNEGDGTFSTALSVSLTYGKGIAAGDVNGDNRPDIYVMRGGTSATGTNVSDLVYLNNGNGTSFTQMPSIPSTSEGRAESVWPIDYDNNGLADFLVLNGEGLSSNSLGPVQLIAFFPST